MYRCPVEVDRYTVTSGGLVRGHPVRGRQSFPVVRIYLSGQRVSRKKIFKHRILGYKSEATSKELATPPIIGGRT